MKMLIFVLKLIYSKLSKLSHRNSNDADIIMFFFCFESIEKLSSISMLANIQ